MIKPQDIVVAIKLHLMQRSEPKEIPTFSFLSNHLRISASEVHASVKRGMKAGLLIRRSEGVSIPRASPQALEEFFIHGLKYVWPASNGVIGRGFATATSLPAVANRLGVPLPEAPSVWKHPDGDIRGETVSPLYGRAVDACLHDSELYEWLALLDVIRLRRGRELDLARRAIPHLL
jgi:hypothetical protein